MEPREPRHGPVLAVLVLGCASLVLGTAGTGTRLFHRGDALEHEALAIQVSNGLLPPSDPWAIDRVTREAWSWHLLVASISEVLGVATFVGGLLLQAVAMGTLVAILWVATATYTRRSSMRAAFVLLPFAAPNPLAPFRLAYVTVTRSVGGVLPLDRTCCLQPLDALPHPTGNLADVFFRLDPDGVGIACFAGALVVLVRARWSTRPRTMAAALGGLLAALLHPPSATAMALAATGVVVAGGWEHLRRRPWRLDLWWHDAMPGLGVLSAAIPVLALTGQLPPLAAPDALLRHAWRAWVLVPVAPAFAVAAWRFARVTRGTRALATAAIAVAAGQHTFAWPDGREYTLGLMAAMAGTLLVLALLDDLAPGWRGATGHGPKMRRRIAAAGIGLGAACLLSNVALLGLSDQAREDPYTWHGTTIDLRVDGTDLDRWNRQDAWRWLREHAPTQAWVLARAAGRHGLELPVVSQRRLVVGVPEGATPTALADRVHRVVDRLASCEIASTDVHRLLALPLRWPRTVYAVAAGPECPDLPQGLAATYHNRGYAVYVLQVPER